MPVDKEEAVRKALTQLLKERGVEPPEDWLSIRVYIAPDTDDLHYIVVIHYAPAKDALCSELDSLTGQEEGARSTPGVWVLSESDALTLCEKHLPDG